MRRGVGLLSILLSFLLSACASTGPPTASPDTTHPPTSSTSTTTTVSPSTTPTTTTPPTASPSTTKGPSTENTIGGQQELPPGVTPPPDWLGTRPLPLDDEGNPVPQPTPPELEDRRFTTTDVLAPPVDDKFHSTITPIPPEVLTRSTWTPECPVGVDELSYVTISFRGFDGLAHTGEMIVNAAAAPDVVSAFAKAFDANYPIEQMTITTKSELDAEPTGDGNNTEAFVCRPVTGGTRWSRHAYGLAVDINPFHNPYIKDGIIIPELATAYEDRTRSVPGLIVEGDTVTEAFDSIGWEWGGRWTSLKDYQHFSSDGR